MKITLINPYDFYAPGIRSIASVLRFHGHPVENIFLLLNTRVLIHSAEGLSCNTDQLEEILNSCRDSDLVGITLMTNAFNLAANITQHIKKNLDIPVIWGGIHPTISPEECLSYADMVCIGEGDVSIVSLVERLQNKKSHLDVEGIWFKHEGKIIKNETPLLIQDLDSLPRHNYEHPNDKVLKKDKLITINHKFAADLLGTQLSVYFSRGCPYRCSFCCNNTLNNIYKNQKIVRYKSPKFIIEEIRQVVSRFNRINRIFFQDDSFLFNSLENIKEFCRLYKEQIDLPFSCFVAAPHVVEEKIKVLEEAGLNDVRMGLQSASPKTLELYNRPISAEVVGKATKIIHQGLKDDKLLSYDVILDNPYETKEDLITTLKFLLTLPRPYTLRLFSLQLYPGTQLYKKAMEEKGSLQDFRSGYYGHYSSPKGTYLNLLFYLMKLIGLRRCPLVLGKLLLRKEMLYLLDTPLVNAITKLLRDLRSYWRYSVKLKIKFLGPPEPPPVIKRWYSNI